MTEFSEGQWARALGAFRAASSYADVDGDSAASRAYYAAFHAATALFALRDQQFTKHTALRAAIHRDLVRTGEWSEELGSNYNDLMDTRHVGDYGTGTSVTYEEAVVAIGKARVILEAISAAAPDHFPVDELPRI